MKCFYSKKLCDNIECNHCWDRSFASCNESEFWNFEKNKDINGCTVIPRKIFKKTGRKYWFDCNNCNHPIFLSPEKIFIGKWCGYCSKPPKNLCNNNNCELCFEKSFASHEKAIFWNKEKNNIEPRYVFKNSNKKFWFDCIKCKHLINISLDKILEGRWCPYCCIPSRLLCTEKICEWCFKKSFASHEKAIFWNKEKNNIEARYVFKKSSKKIWFDCIECNNIFNSSLINITSGSWCPYCKNKTEKKFFRWLITEKIKFEKEKKFLWGINHKTNRYLPFDFFLPDFNTIIEIDGNQHVKYVKYFKTALEYTKERDNYKEQLAIDNGFCIIRICQEDVYYDRFDWKKQVLEKLNLIKTEKNTNKIFYISSKNFYKNF